MFKVPTKSIFSYDLISYVDVFPSETWSQTEDMLYCLSDLHNSVWDMPQQQS